MSSNYLPPSGVNNVVKGYIVPRKLSLPSSPRAFPVGTPLWSNGSGGVEPALELPAVSSGSSLEAMNSLFLSYGFVGFAAEARVPQQLQETALFSVAGDAVAGIEDSSKPFLTVYGSGSTVISPCTALGGQHEVGEFVNIDGFTNEASTGFYSPDGTLIKDTSHYLYNNKMKITTNANYAIGELVERALTGQTYLVFKVLEGLGV